jgi:hypothetical protein
MRYIEAPVEYAGDGLSLFLAGGISDCPPWQSEIVQNLADTQLTILNPRRARFPMADPSAAEAQITWEFCHLRRATWRLFWFPPQTLCPIALYELGSCTGLVGRLFVGTHRNYARRRDVEIQMRLARPDVQIVQDLNELTWQVRACLAADCGMRL